MATLERKIWALVADSQAADLPPPETRRRVRVQAGVTQRQLADALGVSRPALTHWERGAREPRGLRRVDYAEALSILAAASEGTSDG